MNATQRKKARIRREMMQRQISQIVRNGQFIKGKSASKAPGKKFAKAEHNSQYESGMMLERSPWRTGPTFIRKDTV